MRKQYRVFTNMNWWWDGEDWTTLKQNAMVYSYEDLPKEIKKVRLSHYNREDRVFIYVNSLDRVAAWGLCVDNEE